MSEKIRGYMTQKQLGYLASKEMYYNAIISTNTDADYNIEVEITVIEPIYEYVVLYENEGGFRTTEKYYKDESEFRVRNSDTLKFIQLIEQSKRIR